MQAKTAKILKTIAKVVIILLAYSFAAYKIITSPDTDEIPARFSTLSLDEYLFLAFVLLLMPINWLIETKKWQILIKSIEKIGFLQSFKAVMSGVTVGTITPNRVGEFAGRILFVKPENRTTASYLTIFGDLAQFCATVIFGIIGLLIIGTANSDIPYNAILSIGIACGILIIIMYVKFEAVINCIGKIKFISKHLSKYVPQCKISFRNKLITILLSLLRYLIFCVQFYFSLKFFGMNISPVEAFSAIFATYLCIYLIPNIAAAELGIRTTFAIVFIGIFTTQHSAIALASLLLYIINVGIPILLGGFILIGKKK